MKTISFFAGLLAACLAHADIADVTPAAACNYLANIGLRTTTYRQLAGDKFRCASPSIDIGANNITYSVIGGEKSVDEIKLLINVDNPRDTAPIHRRLKDVANVLAQKLGIELPAEIQTDIATGTSAESHIGNRRISVIRINQSTGDAYTMSVLFK